MQERDVIVIEFEIGNKPNAFFQTSKDGILAPKGALSEVQIKPATYPGQGKIQQATTSANHNLAEFVQDRSYKILCSTDTSM